VRLTVMSYDTLAVGRKRLAVADGRTAVGTVEQTSAGFVATDTTGRIIGTFSNFVEAVRALPAVAP
jgi:hypothetical protein